MMMQTEDRLGVDSYAMRMQVRICGTGNPSGITPMTARRTRSVRDLPLIRNQIFSLQSMHIPFLKIE